MLKKLEQFSMKQINDYKRKQRLTLILGVIIIFLVGGFILLGYMFWQTRSQVGEITSQWQNWQQVVKQKQVEQPVVVDGEFSYVNNPAGFGLKVNTAQNYQVVELADGTIELRTGQNSPPAQLRMFTGNQSTYLESWRFNGEPCNLNECTVFDYGWNTISPTREEAISKLFASQTINEYPVFNYENGRDVSCPVNKIVYFDVKKQKIFELSGDCRVGDLSTVFSQLQFFD